MVDENLVQGHLRTPCNALRQGLQHGADRLNRIEVGREQIHHNGMATLGLVIGCTVPLGEMPRREIFPGHVHVLQRNLVLLREIPADARNHGRNIQRPFKGQ